MESKEIIVWVLTGLALVVILLTRVRLGKDETEGPMKVNKPALNVHTFIGLPAFALWVAWLLTPNDSLTGGDVAGIIALALWWVTCLAGLSLLIRWLPSRGRHATNVEEDSWSEGPGLSVLAHGGLLIGVFVFTFYYLTAA
ncbi:hypothetical protein [Nocardioides campestrisoli]|uniref:hypothetical protein n=1 Tax=Nocardioides campestrisoli TaxID=2736757 RepID=UPI0015E799AC|nr:hypothetical protein [Nocardioides campestrisoli]